MTPSPGWDCTWPRVGVRLDLPGDLTEARWFGTGPDESYPDTRRAARVGRFSAPIDDLVVNYSRPQESGHRAGLRELAVADGDGVRLRVGTDANAAGHRPGFTLRRHTPQQRRAGPAPVRAAGQRARLPVPGRRGARRRLAGVRGRRAARSTRSGRARGRSGLASRRHEGRRDRLA